MAVINCGSITTHCCRCRWPINVILLSPAIFGECGLGLVYQGSCIRVGSLVQKEFGDTVVTTMCSNVKGRQVIQGDIIYRRLVLKQVLHTFHVVPLCSHVKWRQPVLHIKTEKTNPCSVCIPFMFRTLTKSVSILNTVGSRRNNSSLISKCRVDYVG